MSIIMGAIAGAGEAGEKYFQQEQKTSNEGHLAQLRSDLELNRSKLIAKNTMDNQDVQRKQEAAEVGDAKTGIIKQAIDQKYATATPADASTWTPEMQASVDQAKQIDADKLQDDPTVVRKAGAKTGYLTTKEDLTSSQNAELGQAKNEMMAQRYSDLNESRERIATLREETRNAISDKDRDLRFAKLEATIAKAGAGAGKEGNTDFTRKVQMLKDSGATPKDIASFILEKKQPSIQDMAAGFLRSDPNTGTKKAMTPEDAVARSKALISLTKDLDGSQPAPTAVPSTKPAAPAVPAKPGKVLNFDAATGTFK